MLRLAPTSGPKSGMCAWSTGVGTAIRMKSASRSSAGSLVYSAWIASAMSASGISRDGSVPARHLATFSSMMSKPIVRQCLPNSTTSGRPT